MHDLVQDLGQSVIEKECCYIASQNDITHLSPRSRHLSISPSWQLDPFHLNHLKSLKTIIGPDNVSIYLSCDILMKCYSLRAVNIPFLREVPFSIGHLKHFRYLKLSMGYFKTLPSSICKLWNLRILNLRNCQDLQKLPNRLKCLKSLQHLILCGCRSLSRLAPEMGQLTGLKTLDTYIVGKQNGFQLAELGNLKLKGTLHIQHLERVRSVMDAQEANLADKHLKVLVLSWERNEESHSQRNVEQILEALQPQAHQLQTLLVKGYFGTHLSQWMGNATLKDLRRLQLADCENCLRISPLEKLPSLRSLKLSNIKSLQFVDDESYDDGAARGFKSLKYLMLEMLPNIMKLSREDGDNMFPYLSMLGISGCPKLSLPCLPSLTKLIIRDECNRALLGSIQNLCNLECLWFTKDKELTSLPDGMLGGLTCLKELHLDSLDKLEVLPSELGNLNALEVLHIVRYNNLKTLTEKAMQGLYSLIALKSLLLCDLRNLASLPDSLGNFRSLKSLTICNCRKLMSLPMSTQSLSGLEKLKIFECPELVERCKDETGEDWHKIAHVSRTYLIK